MVRRLLLPLFLMLAGVVAELPAEAQSRARTGRGYRARTQPRSSDDVRLAPGMRLGRPLALTTDYMGRPIKPKAKLTSTPAKPKGTGATSMSAGSRRAASRASDTKTPAAKPRRR
ncbi:hypothetical protein [Hymenobacter latericus]|uniref:hypothetical protein n=1 Tax=Hymenobacter sp. YIM 151858-1 TaxID=2987688 RepID=UPI002225ED30|nr:hypothetical protein [Hymenobacter sp. YIM 151858-1]UYZ58025.1 hypothetical protein OIS50_13265 [Hymenobacter sp. YIM 151858-1]